MEIKHNSDTYKSRFGDEITNDFDLTQGKRPKLSTAESQLKMAKSLQEFTPVRFNDFDKLKIWVDLKRYADFIEFEDIGLVPMENPEIPETYDGAIGRHIDLIAAMASNLPPVPKLEDVFDENDFSDDIEPETDTNTDTNIETGVFDNPNVVNDSNNRDFNYKAGLSYDVHKETIGLNILYIKNNIFVVCITGKWLADEGTLGILNWGNIRQALQRIINLNVVVFNIDRFLQVANVYACDVCVDVQLDSETQVYHTIQALSSFVPLSTGMYNALKFSNHGLLLLPKAKSNKSAIVIYSKGVEIDTSVRRTTKRTRYTELIGTEGIAQAKRTLRLEIHLWGLEHIRKALNIQKNEPRVVKLIDVLNSTNPVILEYFNYFSGTPDRLESYIKGYIDNIDPETQSVRSIDELLKIKGYVDMLRENNFDLTQLSAHVLTEYSYKLSDNDLKQFNSIASSRFNILNYLVYHKPKSVTRVLDLINRLQEYYGTSNGEVR